MKTQVLSLMILTSCAGIEGKQGAPGNSGSDGHSLISQRSDATLEECVAGGSRIDEYLDLDDSLSVTDGDMLQSSTVTCNGETGEAGPAVTIVAYSSTSCTPIVNTAYYTKRSGKRFYVYGASSCNNSSKKAKLSRGDSLSLPPNSIATVSAEGNALHVVTYEQ